MAGEMTVAEMMAEKAQLEQSIAAMLRAFGESTGLVIDVEVSHAHSAGMALVDGVSIGILPSAVELSLRRIGDTPIPEWVQENLPVVKKAAGARIASRGG